MQPDRRPPTRRPASQRLRAVPPRPADGAGREPDRDPDWLDRLAFTSGIPAVVACLLYAAAALALGVPVAPAGLALVGGGTLTVYNVDRLRDLERDRLTTPSRSAFVSRNAAVLAGLAGGGAVAAAVAATELPPAAWAICAVALGLGLLHRRLKDRALTKAGYVAGAWLAVTAGLPAVESASGAWAIGAALLTYGGALAANLLASNADRLSAEGTGWTHGRALRAAAASATAGLAIALVAPSPVGALGWVPLAQLAGLLAWERSERFRLVVLDGALLVGATASLIALA